MTKGVKILDETIGEGEEVLRQRNYRIRLRCWLNRGEPIRWKRPWGMVDRARLLQDGEVLVTDIRIDREHLVSGLFKGIGGMRVGGTRTMKISPHLAYGENGVPGTIPQNATLICEITFLGRRDDG